MIFVTKWTLACLLGQAVGRGVAVATDELMRSNVVVFLLVSGVVIGVAVGFTQWVLLRGRIDHSQWWILLTTIGSIIGYITANFLRIPGFYPWFSGIVHASVAVGTMQWLVLRRSVSRAAWWILIVSLAGALGLGALRSAFPIFRPLGFIWANALSGAIAGAVSGVITGFGLGILLQRAGKGLGPR